MILAPLAHEIKGGFLAKESEEQVVAAKRDGAGELYQR
jgi:hypothetical protein